MASSSIDNPLREIDPECCSIRSYNIRANRLNDFFEACAITQPSQSVDLVFRIAPNPFARCFRAPYPRGSHARQGKHDRATSQQKLHELKHSMRPYIADSAAVEHNFMKILETPNRGYFIQIQLQRFLDKIVTTDALVGARRLCGRPMYGELNDEGSPMESELKCAAGAP